MPSPLSINAANEILQVNFAPWVRALGITVRETTPDSVTLAVPVNADVNRVGGTVCGQALMALADTAMVIALCSAVGEFRGFPTVDVNTSFLRPASNTGVIAIASVLRLGKTMAFGQARMHTDNTERHLIANATGSYVVPPSA